MKSRHLAFGVSCLLLSGIFALTGSAQQERAALTELVSQRSPDGRFQLVYQNERENGNWISGVKLKEVKTDQVVWSDPQEGRDAYGSVSALWSPSGTQVALVLGEKRSDTLSVLEWKDGQFIGKSLKDPDPPLKKDLGQHFYYRFDSVKAEKWIDEDTIALVYSGRVQLQEETNPQLLKAEWVDYEYRATLSLRDDEVTFSEEGKKLERIKE